MVLDRSKAPPVHENIDIQIPLVNNYQLDNGISVYEVNMGTQEILKLEIIFNAGRTYESKKLVGRATASLLKEATSNYSAPALAEMIDFYGSTLASSSNMDHSNLILMSLSKHLKPLLNIIRDVWENPLFPEEELVKYKKKVKQQLKINLAKNEIIAYREFTRKVFGDHHPYGFNSTESLFKELRREDLLDHYKQNYFKPDTLVFLSGKINASHQKALNETLGSINLNAPLIKPQIPDISTSLGGNVKIDGKQRYQTAIRLGKKLFNRSNEDYPVFYLMNIIFGGYFGSRLMKNIREEKAFTYGIHSYIDTLKHDGYFSISTEVGNEYVEPTIHEIRSEMQRIKHDLVSDHEFKMAKNYLLGQFLSMMDGPLRVSQVLKTMTTNGFDLGFIRRLTEEIKKTTKEQIRNAAQKYLLEEDLWEVTVGG